MSETVWNGYYEEVRKKLVGPSQEKRTFLNGLKENVTNYIEENPGATQEDIRRQFGEPEMVAEEFLAAMPEKGTIQKNIRLKKIAIGAFIAAALIALILYAVHVADFWSFTHGYSVEGPAIAGVTTPDPNALETY